MADKGRKIFTSAALAAGAIIGVSALVAPRVGDETVDSRWMGFSRWRYAHRGLHDLSVLAPENSFAAFKRARQAGFAAELDVHLTADKRLVVIHDSSLRRVCGVDGIVENLTFQELQAFPLQATGERIPSLERILALYDRTGGADGTVALDKDAPPLLIEIKTHGDNAAEVTRATMEVLDQFNVRYLMQSFDPRVLEWLKTYRPEIVRGQLAENFLGDVATNYLGMPTRLMLSALFANAMGRPDFVSYKFRDRHNVFVMLTRGLGARMANWTLKSQKDLLRAEREGAVAIFDGFIPDSPYAISHSA